VLSKIKQIACDSPVVFMGDLNGGRDTNWYLLLANSGLLKDSNGLVEKPYQLNGSFNGFNANEVRKDVIDHVFVTNHFSAKRWAVLTDTYFGKFPSDHFPVAVEINF
jgi:endonuclease/exonuclease/phosphatase family metal-dependent hydrolase